MLTTYSDATISARTQETHRQAIRELVARDKNHPCVVIWSIANEPDTVAPEARAYFEPLVAETRRLDPTRPVGFANFMKATPERDVVSDLFDVLLLNRYFGWYVHTGDLESAERALEAELREWAQRGKPIIMTEYGADTQSGPAQPDERAVERGVPDRPPRHVPPRVRPHRRGGRRADLELRRLRHRSGIMRVDGNKKGVFTRDRRPKAAAHALRRRWRAARDGRDCASRAEAPNERQAGLRLPQYLGYGAGDAANNLTFSMSSMFLLLYYTDVVGHRRHDRGNAVPRRARLRRVRRPLRRTAGRPDQHALGPVPPATCSFAAIPLLLLNVAVFTVPDLGATGDARLRLRHLRSCSGSPTAW